MERAHCRRCRCPRLPCSGGHCTRDVHAQVSAEDRLRQRARWARRPGLGAGCVTASWLWIASTSSVGLCLAHRTGSIACTPAFAAVYLGPLGLEAAFPAAPAFPTPMHTLHGLQLPARRPQKPQTPRPPYVPPLRRTLQAYCPPLTVPQTATRCRSRCQMPARGARPGLSSR